MPDLTPETFAACVRAYLGTPYSHQGRTPGERLDCIGVPVCALLSLGWQPRDAESAATLNYSATARDDTLERLVSTEMQGIELCASQPGDLLLFRWPREQHAAHCGVVSQIISGTPHFIHAYNSRLHGVACEQSLRDEWQGLLCGVYRLHCFL